MELENKFNEFNLTNEMIDNFRYLINLHKDPNEQNQNYTTKTIIFNKHGVGSNNQGTQSVKLG